MNMQAIHNAVKAPSTSRKASIAFGMTNVPIGVRYL